MKPEHQRFAEVWVRSQNATDAYARTMGTKNRKTAERMAAKWLQRRDVQDYIQQLRGQAVLLLQGAAEREPRFSRLGRRAAADLAEILAILTAQARGEAATEFERTHTTVGEAVGDPTSGVPIPPIVSELLKLIPEEYQERAQALSREVTLESRTMTFQPMKAAGLLLGHLGVQKQQTTAPDGGSAWVKLMDSDPKLARMLTIKFLQMERSD